MRQERLLSMGYEVRQEQNDLKFESHFCFGNSEKLLFTELENSKILLSLTYKFTFAHDCLCIDSRILKNWVWTYEYWTK